MLAVGISVVGPAPLKGQYAEGGGCEEFARPLAAQLVAGDSPGQHRADSHGEERLRAGIGLHGIPADCGRRAEHALRGHHHGCSRKYTIKRLMAAARSAFLTTEPRIFARWLPIPTRRCLIVAAKETGRGERQTYREGRRGFRRRQEHLLRRPGQRAAVEPYDSGPGRSDEHHGVESRWEIHR